MEELHSTITGKHCVLELMLLYYVITDKACYLFCIFGLFLVLFCSKLIKLQLSVDIIEIVRVVKLFTAFYQLPVLFNYHHSYHYIFSACAFEISLQERVCAELNQFILCKYSSMFFVCMCSSMEILKYSSDCSFFFFSC